MIKHEHWIEGWTDGFAKALDLVNTMVETLVDSNELAEQIFFKLARATDIPIERLAPTNAIAMSAEFIDGYLIGFADGYRYESAVIMNAIVDMIRAKTNHIPIRTDRDQHRGFAEGIAEIRFEAEGTAITARGGEC